MNTEEIISKLKKFKKTENYNTHNFIGELTGDDIALIISQLSRPVPSEEEINAWVEVLKDYNSGFILGSNPDIKRRGKVNEVISFLSHLQEPEAPVKEKEPEDRFSKFAGSSIFPKREETCMNCTTICTARGLSNNTCGNYTKS